RSRRNESPAASDSNDSHERRGPHDLGQDGSTFFLPLLAGVNSRRSPGPAPFDAHDPTSSPFLSRSRRFRRRQTVARAMTPARSGPRTDRAPPGGIDADAW